MSVLLKHWIGSSGSSWTSRYTFLRSGPIQYRREINRAGGYFKLDYSEDSGVTWENLETLDLTENLPMIDLAHLYRHRIVDYEYRVDNFLTGLGYAGVEGVDWENLYTTSGYWTPQEDGFPGIPQLYAGTSIGAGAPYVRSCVLVNGVYHMFYERERGTGWAICKKTSLNGLIFENLVDELFPVGGAGAYDELGQADATVIYDGVGDWKMWGEGLAVGTIYTEWDKIFYAQSVDGILWTKTGIAIGRGDAGSWDDGYIHHPCVIKHNGVYYMMYTGARSSNAYKYIGVATSPDGVNWTKYAGNPVISGVIGEFDQQLARPSNPILVNGVWYMWYYGLNGVYRVGLATSSDLMTWERKGKQLDIDHTGSANILVQGINKKDIIIQHWFAGADASPGGFATITIPTAKTMLSEFLDSQEFGDDNITGGSTSNAGYVYYYKVVVTGNKFPTSRIRMFISLNSKPTTGKVKMALYNDIGGTAGALLGVTEEKNWSNITLGNCWYEFDFVTPINILDGTYWFATQSEHDFFKTKVAGGSANWGYQAQAYGNFPVNAAGNTSSNYSGIGISMSCDNETTLHQIALVGNPNDVYFNNIKGNKQISLIAVDSEFDWYWESGILYIYSIQWADLRYQITYD